MYRIIKRFFDIVFSFSVLVLLLPLLIPVVIILLLTGEHYVFYLQKRMGYKNRPFNIIKFATMLKNSPNLGTGSITIKHDPRVLPFGRFLRKTKINEIPQFLNVLFGDMSLVGPRPLMEKDFLRYPPHIREKIYDIKPGLTGIGSIVFRDEESILSRYKGQEVEAYERIIAPYKGELELWYQENISWWVDIKILVLTLLAIISPNPHLPHRFFKNLPKAEIYFERF